ncbi:hypothetical protein CEXT_54681 [Caerostris extrusa]|uniref:Uncharacterized protein n=1 Tax=Caerostris extrusa TaxID=172846 RepID=A0AAV4NGE5_CAEEX|nr:hypothetical protein CEXT_54681 [Caerostris extrusa]
MVITTNNRFFRRQTFLPGYQSAENVFISKSISISDPSAHPFIHSSLSHLADRERNLGFRFHSNRMPRLVCVKNHSRGVRPSDCRGQGIGSPRPIIQEILSFQKMIFNEVGTFLECSFSFVLEKAKISVQPTRGQTFLPDCQIAENVFISKSISISIRVLIPHQHSSSSLAPNPFEDNQYLLPRHFSLPRNSHMAREQIRRRVKVERERGKERQRTRNLRFRFYSNKMRAKISVQPTRGQTFLPGCRIAENVFISKSISIFECSSFHQFLLSHLILLKTIRSAPWTLFLKFPYGTRANSREGEDKARDREREIWNFDFIRIKCQDSCVC